MSPAHLAGPTAHPATTTTASETQRCPSHRWDIDRGSRTWVGRPVTLPGMPTDRDLDPRELPGDPIPAGELAAAYRAALPCSTVHQARVVWWVLASDPDLELSTVTRIGPVIARFAARQRTLGRSRLDTVTVDDALGFLWARTRRGIDPAVATVHLRRTALRMLFRALSTLDVDADDPTQQITIPPKTRTQLRPLDDHEISLLRVAAAGRTRGRLLGMASIALAEATATTGEIAALTWDALRPGHPDVRLPGAGRIRPRLAMLTPWGTRAVTDLAHHSSRAPDMPGTSVVYRGAAAPGSQPSQAAIVNRITHLLTLAGLDDPDVRPASIRLWQPAQILAAGGSIEQAANQLGLASLDIAAAQLGHCWQARG